MQSLVRGYTAIERLETYHQIGGRQAGAVVLSLAAAINHAVDKQHDVERVSTGSFLPSLGRSDWWLIAVAWTRSQLTPRQRRCCSASAAVDRGREEKGPVLSFDILCVCVVCW